MAWLLFFISAAVIVAAATQLAKYGDVIAIRTRLGGMFIGILLLAGATSLPEVLTSISAIQQGTPNLAAGNLLGSNAFNMLLLAVLDLVYRKHRVLRSAALRHALTGSLAIFLISMVAFFLLAGIDTKIGWIGVDSIAIMVFYIISVKLIHGNQVVPSASLPGTEVDPETPKLLTGIIGFSLAAIVLVLITPLMVKNADIIAAETGLGTSFIGTTLVALVTSLPELVTTLAAMKIGATDMAIGNLFGSNMFNMFALGFSDLFFTEGRLLAAIDPSFVLVSVIGLIMTCIALIGNVAKLEHRILFLEIDAALLILFYIGGMWLLYLM